MIAGSSISIESDKFSFMGSLKGVVVNSALGDRFPVPQKT